MIIICENRKAKFEYTILAKYTAGIVLLGCEIKSIRSKKCNINDAYIAFQQARPVIYHMHIDPYSNSFLKNDPKRIRKLLMKKTEINKLLGRLQQNNLTLIPLKIFISETGYAKIEFGLCQGKKLFDKRESIKQRDLELEMKRKLRF